MAQAAHIFHHFYANILHKIGILQRINAASEGEILPDEDSVSVAQIVKTLTLV